MEDGVFRLESWGRVDFFVAILVTPFFLFLISRLTSSRRNRNLRLPPGPKGWPLLGALPYVGKFPHKSLHKLAKEHGPVMYLHLGSLPTLVISNGEMAKEVLLTNDQHCASRPQFLVPEYFTYKFKSIVWNPYGPHWRENRKMINLKLLTSSRLRHFMNTLEGEVLNAIHTLLGSPQSGGRDNINATRIVNGMTMNIMTMMMWNKRRRNVDESEHDSDQKLEMLLRNSGTLLASNNIADFLPSTFLKSIVMRLSGLDRKAKAIQKDRDEFWDSILQEKEHALALSKEFEAKPAEDEDDFVTVLLKHMSGSQDSDALSRDGAKAVLGETIVAGTDTTSLTLIWILSELLKHPEIVKKAQDELMAVVGQDRLVREADIPNLKYLDAVVKEGLRMHPAAPVGIPHLSMANCKIGGYDVPANTTIFINMFSILHDPAVWENPFDFDPDRFLRAPKEYRGQNYDFIPFSSGRRSCPGMNLASTVLHIGLAQFLHTVSWSLPEGHAPENLDMTDSPGLTNARASPLLVNVKPRLAHHVIYPTTV